ncbi:LLM class flavin-dependent oxidoreductase [Nocardia transvalensis]|uniref:LLM class flavin-dependent oxidoreductase n=1 Tax=Nocardia transvalensis TaxID=37333 RepID=UPI0018952685|nr:LLM class flavin-dependent oxidoreductase [Nocardia transvalensis]MBF6331153.1 LLM class flavin-dependent oxidoreductase [Nocardia transvalensis]
MRVDYAPWGQTLAELAEAARAAESAGAATIWVPELHRSATISAAAVAPALTRAGVGTAVALGFARSPLVTALEALDLDELAGGRFVLGIGTGTRRLMRDWHDADWEQPVARMRDTVAAIRTFVAGAHRGEPMDNRGSVRRLRMRGYRRPYRPVRQAIPIHLAAVGPRLTRLAGEIADGWLSHELCSPKYLNDVVLPRLAEGLGASGRSRPQLRVVASVCCSVDDDATAAWRRARGTVGFYASVAGYRDLFEAHGLADEQAEVVRERRAGADADALAHAVPESMVRPLVAAGTVDEVVERIGAYAGKADAVKLSPAVYGVAPQEVRTIQGRLFEVIREVAR